MNNSRKRLIEITNSEPCTPDHLYKMECNRCHCTNAGKLLCTQMKCEKKKQKKSVRKLRSRNSTDAHNTKEIKKKHLWKAKLKQKKAPRSTDNKKTLPELPQENCVPGKLYKSGCKRCHCNASGRALCSTKSEACPDKDGTIHLINKPEDVRPPFTREELKKAKILATESEQCEPGSYYTVSCNTCVCTDKGNLLCSKELCLSFEDMNRVEAAEKTGQPCTSDTPHTKESCIDCKCIDSKLSCSEIPSCFPQTRMKLSSASKNAIQLKLDPAKDKCIPNAIYRENCNRCYCQSDGTLRCTQKTCLVYSQAEELRKQMKRLTY